MRTLLDLLPEMLCLGKREAVRFHNGFRTWRLSYRQLSRRIGAFSRYLQQNGLQKGDRLLLWGENRPEWIVVFWGCLARGVEVVPIDPQSSPQLVRRVHEEIRAKLLVHGPTVAWSSVEMPRLAFEDVENLGENDTIDFAEVGPEDVVQIVYTSGTTGEPKGVVHRHRNICSNLEMFQREMARYRMVARPFQPIRILDLLPLSHLFGQSLGVFFPILLRGAVVFLSELHPSVVIKTIHRERVSVAVSVPRLLANLRRQVERQFVVAPGPFREGLLSALGRWWTHRDVHRAFGWKFWAIVVGGARLPPEEEDFWWRLGLVVVQGYGLTETSPIVAVNHPLRPRRGSMGWVVQGQDVRIASDGEILVRGASVVTDYLGAAPDSGTVFRDGWLHTGDLGEMDSEGRLYFRGRKKDVIVTSDGLNVYPQDVESALDRRPEIRASVVIGLPSNGEDRVHAVLLLDQPDSDPEATVHWVNRELEPHQRIRSWSVWPEEDFPRTASTFKVRRGEVRKRILTEREGRPTTAEESRATGLVTTLAQMTGRSPSDIQGDLRLEEDLGLSSLDRVDLLSQLESDYGVDLDESLFVEIASVSDLDNVVQRARAPLGGGETGGTGPVSRPEMLRDSRAVSSRRNEMPRWPRLLPFAWLRHAVLRLVALPLWRHYVEFSVEGLSYLDGVEPPVFFVANHASHLDTIAILAALPFRWRKRVAPAMQKEHFRAYFEPRGFKRTETLWRAIQYGLACGLVNAYPLPHEMAGVRKALRFTGELVQSGYCPLVYPEGERTPDGTMRAFKPGIGLMATRLRAPVVPVHLEGMFGIYSIHDSWPRTGKVRLRFGPALHSLESEDHESVTQHIEKAVQELRSTAARSIPSSE